MQKELDQLLQTYLPDDYYSEIRKKLTPRLIDFIEKEKAKNISLPPEMQVVETMGYMANRLEQEDINNGNDSLIWKQGFMCCYNALKRWKKK